MHKDTPFYNGSLSPNHFVKEASDILKSLTCEGIDLEDRADSLIYLLYSFILFYIILYSFIIYPVNSGYNHPGSLPSRFIILSAVRALLIILAIRIQASSDGKFGMASQAVAQKESLHTWMQIFDLLVCSGMFWLICTHMVTDVFSHPVLVESWHFVKARACNGKSDALTLNPLIYIYKYK